MENSPIKEVVVRPGILGYGLSLIELVLGVGVLSIPLRLLLQPTNDQSSLSDILLGWVILTAFVAVGIAFIWFALVLVKQRYFVSLEGVDVKRLKKSRFISWRDVAAFGEIPTVFGISIYFVELVDGSKVMFYIPFMARPERSAKALIEAANTASPNIQFTFFLGNEYGKPPYGIFKSEQRE